MPREKINYSKTIIYKLACRDMSVKEIYIDHTTDLTKRKCRHKATCNNSNDSKYNLYVYRFIRDNGGWNNWEMVILEIAPCNDSLDASVAKRKWIDLLSPSLNGEPIVSEIPKFQGIPTQKKEEVVGKVVCTSCGLTIMKSNIARHNKTKKHLKMVGSLTD